MQLAVECEGPRAGPAGGAGSFGGAVLALAFWWLGPSPLVISCSAWGPRAGGGAEPTLTDSGEDPTRALVSPCVPVLESAST